MWHFANPWVGEGDERKWITKAPNDWVPGQYGKGYIAPDDQVIAWRVDDDGDPHHVDFPEAQYQQQLIIHPDGRTERVWDDQEVTPEQWDNLMNRGLYLGDRINDEYDPYAPRVWNFESAFDWSNADPNGNVIDWEEGQEGKGIIDYDGHIFIWVDDYDYHDHFLMEHPDLIPQHQIYVRPTGECWSPYGPIDEVSANALHDADPRLYASTAHQDTWHF